MYFISPIIVIIYIYTRILYHNQLLKNGPLK